MHLNALGVLLEVHSSFGLATTRPAHIMMALTALKPGAEHLFFFFMTIVLVLVNRYSYLTFRIGTQLGAVLKIKSI